MTQLSPSFLENILLIIISRLKTRNPLADSEDPDEMLHNAVLHQGLHCLLRQSIFRERNTIFLEMIACDPLVDTMDHPDLTVSTSWEIPLVLKGYNTEKAWSHSYPSLVLVQPRKTRPYITERLLMGRKESNQTNMVTLVGPGIYSINTFFYYLNIDFFGRAKSKIIDKEQTEKNAKKSLQYLSCKCHL